VITQTQDPEQHTGPGHPQAATPRWRSLLLGETPRAAGDRWPVAVYCASRVILLAVAGIVALATGRSLGGELSLFDGKWYLQLAQHGYPTHAVLGQSVLGFLPGYPLAMIAVSRLLHVPLTVGGLVVSFAGGLTAAVLVRRLAASWWGEITARRAVLLFCLFPGSVVFSMVYSEGLTVPLALGCLLALRSHRWALAGTLAALAGTVNSAALVLIPACIVVAVRHLAAAGWRDRSARASLLAPLLAPVGIGAFAVFLWAWTGTPFASYQANTSGWHTGLTAVLSQPLTHHLADHPADALGYLGNLSLWNGVAGTIFMGFSLVALWRHRHQLSPGAMAFTIGIAAITLWSVMTLPNARLLLIAFPTVIVWARRLPARRFPVYLVAQTLVFILASAVTFAGLMLP
jgi:mannosyltransferase PIG-V